jgi:hypothetical protein
VRSMRETVGASLRGTEIPETGKAPVLAPGRPLR